jgi:hypothetical protein
MLLSLHLRGSQIVMSHGEGLEQVADVGCRPMAGGSGRISERDTVEFDERYDYLTAGRLNTI